MLRIPCPKCHKVSYTTGVESFNSCTYCGFVFSGKFGPDKRSEPRVEQEIPFALSYQGQNFEASTADLSEKGVGIRIMGEPPIAVGDVLNLTIGNYSIAAKVMWVKKLPDKALAGLSRLN
jgi:hypothetical protein